MTDNDAEATGRILRDWSRVSIQLGQMFTRIEPSIYRFQEIARQMREPLMRALELSGWIQQWYRDLGRALAPFNEWLQAQQEAMAVLVDRGWWPHPHWSAGLMIQVLRLKREKRLRSLDRMICEAYEYNRFRAMRQALRRWSTVPEFKERAGILEDGMWAYSRGRYRLAISAWLPQVEGILRGVTDRHGWSSAGWKRTISDLTNERSFITAFLALFDSGRGPVKGRGPRRHAIAHGRAIRFGRRVYALRIFLILDALHYFIHEFETRESRVA